MGSAESGQNKSETRKMLGLAAKGVVYFAIAGLALATGAYVFNETSSALAS